MLSVLKRPCSRSVLGAEDDEAGAAGNEEPAPAAAVPQAPLGFQFAAPANSAAAAVAPHAFGCDAKASCNAQAHEVDVLLVQLTPSSVLCRPPGMPGAPPFGFPGQPMYGAPPGSLPPGGYPQGAGMMGPPLLRPPPFGMPPFGPPGAPPPFGMPFMRGPMGPGGPMQGGPVPGGPMTGAGAPSGVAAPAAQGPHADGAPAGMQPLFPIGATSAPLAAGAPGPPVQEAPPNQLFPIGEANLTVLPGVVPCCSICAALYSSAAGRACGCTLGLYAAHKSEAWNTMGCGAMQSSASADVWLGDVG